MKIWEDLMNKKKSNKFNLIKSIVIIAMVLFLVGSGLLVAM